MAQLLDELQLTTLVASIHGISAVGAAAILAESGDPHRFATARAMVKHAGLAPREKLSGTFIGRTKLTGQGRPRLRVAAWRAVWGSLQTNTVALADSTHAGYQSKAAKGHDARPIDGQIAFFANAEDGVSNNIAFTVNPDGKALQQLPVVPASQPHWSPDGTEIALDAELDSPTAPSAVILNPTTGTVRECAAPSGECATTGHPTAGD